MHETKATQDFKDNNKQVAQTWDWCKQHVVFLLFTKWENGMGYLEKRKCIAHSVYLLWNCSTDSTQAGLSNTAIKWFWASLFIVSASLSSLLIKQNVWNSTIPIAFNAEKNDRQENNIVRGNRLRCLI